MKSILPYSTHAECYYLYENDMATFYLLILTVKRLDALYKNIWSLRIYQIRIIVFLPCPILLKNHSNHLTKGVTVKFSSPNKTMLIFS